MAIKQEDVVKVAYLARIALDTSQVERVTDDLAEVFKRVDAMAQVDTQGIEPMAHPLDIVQRLRDDVVTEEDQRALLQKGAPSKEAGLYLVPKVIE